MTDEEDNAKMEQWQITKYARVDDLTVQDKKKEFCILSGFSTPFRLWHTESKTFVTSSINCDDSWKWWLRSTRH